MQRVEDRSKFDIDLVAPLPGREAQETPAVVEAEQQSFQQFMGEITAFQGGGG